MTRESTCARVRGEEDLGGGLVLGRDGGRPAGGLLVGDGADYRRGGITETIKLPWRMRGQDRSGYEPFVCGIGDPVRAVPILAHWQCRST
jgi:hypothetical protein